MKDQRWGIEIEMTGLTRCKAAEVAAQYFGSTARYEGGGYGAWSAEDSQGRKWRFVSDSSIDEQVKRDGRIINISDAEYRVELVSPICVYDDIPTVQELVRKLRAAGGLANASTGVHVHINGAPFDAQKLRNLCNIMASKENLLYKALEVNVAREHGYCKKVDYRFLEELNQRKPKTLEDVQSIWYNGNDGSHQHYHNSRYRGLNLHAMFTKGTCEWRLFNGTMHAGKIKSYIQLCLAISHQALSQRYASRARTASTNEKYTFRTWLLRLGMIGEEFATARLHLLEHLDGNIAWKDPAQAERQKERMRQKKEKELERALAQSTAPQAEIQQDNSLDLEPDAEQAPGLSMSM